MSDITLLMDLMAARRDKITTDWERDNLVVLDDVEGTKDTVAGPVTLTVLQEVGPGGGWPEVTVVGTAPAVLQWLLNLGWDLDTALLTLFTTEHDHRRNPIDGSRVDDYMRD
jgi:hypothetical protein